MVLSTDGSFGACGELEECVLHGDGITTFKVKNDSLRGGSRKVDGILFLSKRVQMGLKNGKYVETTVTPSGVHSSGSNTYKVIHLIMYDKKDGKLEEVYVDTPSGIDIQD